MGCGAGGDVPAPRCQPFDRAAGPLDTRDAKPVLQHFCLGGTDGILDAVQFLSHAARRDDCRLGPRFTWDGSFTDAEAGARFRYLAAPVSDSKVVRQLQIRIITWRSRPCISPIRTIPLREEPGSFTILYSTPRIDIGVCALGGAGGGNCGGGSRRLWAHLSPCRAAPSPVLDSRYRWLLPHTYACPHESPLRRILTDERPDLVEVCDKFWLIYLSGVLRRGWIPGVPVSVIAGLSCERLDVNVAASHEFDRKPVLARPETPLA
jgi:hypothetical protein